MATHCSVWGASREPVVKTGSYRQISSAAVAVAAIPNSCPNQSIASTSAQVAYAAWHSQLGTLASEAWHADGQLWHSHEERAWKVSTATAPSDAEKCSWSSSELARSGGAVTPAVSCMSSTQRQRRARALLKTATHSVLRSHSSSAASARTSALQSSSEAFGATTESTASSASMCGRQRPKKIRTRFSFCTHITHCGLFVAGLDCSRLLAALSSLPMDDDVLELDEEEWVPVPIDSLTVKELKDELGSRGLRKGGTRDILIDRLVDALNGTKTLPRPEDPLDSEEVVPEALPVSFEQALGDTLAENLLLVSGGLDGCPSSLPVEMQPPHIRPRDEPTVRVIDYDPHLLALHKPSGLPGEEDKKPTPHLHRPFTPPLAPPPTPPPPPPPNPPPRSQPQGGCPRRALRLR